MLPANDPRLTSWVPVPENSDFPIQNLPFGVFESDALSPRVGVAIGEQVLDLKSMHVLGYLDNLPFTLADFDSHSLNAMMAHGKLACRELRSRISKLLSSSTPDLKNKQHHVDQVLVPQTSVRMLLPCTIGDYTDFYSSREHATNVGSMFRDPNNALLPNWLHIPVGYHGRASSVVVSGTPIRRPKGQTRPDDSQPPVFGPCKLLDFELEMGFFTFDGKPLGESISTDEADDSIFGLVLFNDWSARDIQKWEYVPLGPFLAKNFASHVSPWVVTLDALEPFRHQGPVQEPAVLPYLEQSGPANYDVNLEVAIRPEGADETVVCSSNMKYLYWSMRQQLAHHSVGGCNIRCGDLLASGTISGSTPDSYGSMLEITWRGTKPVQMTDGTERKFVQDGDTVVMRGHAKKDGIRVGFGTVEAVVLPAHS